MQICRRFSFPFMFYWDTLNFWNNFYALVLLKKPWFANIVIVAALSVCFLCSLCLVFYSTFLSIMPSFPQSNGSSNGVVSEDPWKNRLHSWLLSRFPTGDRAEAMRVELQDMLYHFPLSQEGADSLHVATSSLVDLLTSTTFSVPRREGARISLAPFFGRQ